MYSERDQYRFFEEPESELGAEPYRSAWRRDVARLVHSASFRRLQGKTQLFPGHESDFFRTRLSHSMEVAQIAKSIAIRLNNTSLKDSPFQINEDICEFAGLAHDIGHPPFGHQGEEALDECMRDAGGFEGNAQTLRILTRLEKKIPLNGSDNPNGRFGLNITSRSLASVLKYDRVIPFKQSSREGKWKDRPVKGYYEIDADLVQSIKKNTVEPDPGTHFKTVECQIMDIADDIAYSTYDLEDGLKANFLEPFDILFAEDEVLEKTAQKVSDRGYSYNAHDVRDCLFEIFGEIFEVEISKKLKETLTKEHFAITLSSAAYQASKKIASDGYYRTAFSSRRVGQAIRNVSIRIDKNHPSLSEIQLNDDVKVGIEVLKHFIYESQVNSPKLKISEYRGKQIVSEVFDILINNDGLPLLPDDIQKMIEKSYSYLDKQRIICDFISGMTDRYCVEFLYRIKSENPATIFKPY